MMKALLRKLFSPILNIFEQGNEPYIYKPSHRTILIVLGCLFLLFTSGLVFVGIQFAEPGAALPGVIFFAVAVTSLVVGSLGDERAVAKIWGSKK